MTWDQWSTVLSNNLIVRFYFLIVGPRNGPINNDMHQFFNLLRLPFRYKIRIIWNPISILGDGWMVYNVERILITCNSLSLFFS